MQKKLHWVSSQFGDNRLSFIILNGWALDFGTHVNVDLVQRFQPQVLKGCSIIIWNTTIWIIYLYIIIQRTLSLFTQYNSIPGYYESKLSQYVDKFDIDLSVLAGSDLCRSERNVNCLHLRRIIKELPKIFNPTTILHNFHKKIYFQHEFFQMLKITSFNYQYRINLIISFLFLFNQIICLDRKTHMWDYKYIFIMSQGIYIYNRQWNYCGTNMIIKCVLLYTHRLKYRQPFVVYFFLVQSLYFICIIESFFRMLWCCAI